MSMRRPDPCASRAAVLAWRCGGLHCLDAGLHLLDVIEAHLAFGRHVT